MTLDELFIKWHSDKSSKGHNYISVYEHVLPRNAKKVFELGVAKGGSLMAWKNWFNEGCQIHCLDMFGDPDHVNQNWCKGKGFITYKGDTRKEETFEQITEKFDVIIEDCGHTSSAQVLAFKHTFMNNLNSGGVYCAEDLHCCNEGFYRDGLALRFEDTLLGTLKSFVAPRKTSWLEGLVNTKYEPKWVNPYFTPEESEQIATMIDDVRFFCDDKLAIIRKK
jgi:hypothetical protein